MKSPEKRSWRLKRIREEEATVLIDAMEKLDAVATAISEATNAEA